MPKILLAPYPRDPGLQIEPSKSCLLRVVITIRYWISCCFVGRWRIRLLFGSWLHWNRPSLFYLVPPGNFLKPFLKWTTVTCSHSFALHRSNNIVE